MKRVINGFIQRVIKTMITYNKKDIPEHLQKYFEPAELGLEKTPEEYVANLVAVFSEVKRLLKDDGTLWLNLGDSYASGRGRYSSSPQTISGKADRGEPISGNRPDQRNHNYLKDKDLCMIPARVAIALQKSGWWLRQNIIWSKPNPMPESVRDRCTKSHEYIFLLTKSSRYYYDADAIKEDSIDEESYTGWRPRGVHQIAIHDTKHAQTISKGKGKVGVIYETRNRRSVWEITTQPYSGAHFATFPEEIPTICIKAGSKKGDTVLDPFCGSGTTGDVALRLERNFIGIELNKKYIDELIIPRLENINPLFR